MTRKALLILFAAASLGTSTAACSQAIEHPVDHVENQGLRVIPVTIQTADGAHSFKMEVAETMEQQEIGLMNRTELKAKRGMIFPNDPPREVGFWMKNTLISLDLLFVDAGGTIVRIAHDAQPNDLTPIMSGQPIRATIEIQGGLAEKLGIEEGDSVQYGAKGI